MSPPARAGIIGGSGLYDIEGFSGRAEERLATPFGEPSDPYITGELDGVPVVFLSRHGRGHRLLPTEINFRANIWGLKKLGVTRVLSVSAVGSMKEDIAPGHMVVPEQFIDLTRHRTSTFFGGGVVGHAVFADPICAETAGLLADAAESAGATTHRGGTYVNIEGPQFSTRAESLVYRSWGVSVIGMTNATEAKCAREAGLCYATLALVTDYDCWHEDEEDVSIAAVLAVMNKNISVSKQILRTAVSALPLDTECPHATAMQHSVITDRRIIPDKVKKDLALIVGDYL